VLEVIVNMFNHHLSFDGCYSSEPEIASSRPVFDFPPFVWFKRTFGDKQQYRFLWMPSVFPSDQCQSTEENIFNTLAVA